MDTWQSEVIQIDASTHVQVRANSVSVVLAQGDDVWFHDLHLTPDQAVAISCALNHGAVKCLAARGGQ